MARQIYSNGCMALGAQLEKAQVCYGTSALTCLSLFRVLGTSTLFFPLPFLFFNTLCPSSKKKCIFDAFGLLLCKQRKVTTISLNYCSCLLGTGDCSTKETEAAEVASLVMHDSVWG